MTQGRRGSLTLQRMTLSFTILRRFIPAHSRAENEPLHYVRTKGSTDRRLRCHLWGGFASFYWNCFGECLRADSEHQVERVVSRASRNANAEPLDR